MPIGRVPGHASTETSQEREGLRAELGCGKCGPLTEDTLSEMTELSSYVCTFY